MEEQLLSTNSLNVCRFLVHLCLVQVTSVSFRCISISHSSDRQQIGLLLETYRLLGVSIIRGFSFRQVLEPATCWFVHMERPCFACLHDRTINRIFNRIGYSLLSALVTSAQVRFACFFAFFEPRYACAGIYQSKQESKQMMERSII